MMFSWSAPEEIWIVAQSGPGRLGNQMFQFASALGVSHQMNGSPSKFCVDPDHPFAFRDIFRGPFPECPKTILDPKKIQHLPEGGYGIYTAFDTQASCGQSTCVYTIGPYLQSFKYLQLAGREIRSAFRFQQPILDRAHDALRFVRANTATALVGIHVRRGDIQIVPYLQTPPAAYYRRAMQHFSVRFRGNVVFVVASDDMEWCRENFQDVTFLENNKPAVDLAALSLADHMILSVGTFGWWGAWMGAGDVIYYKDAIVMDHPTNINQINLQDYYPPTWIGMT